MAEVYLATAQGAEGFEKPVVIKRIRPQLATDASFVEMFIAEAHLASHLSHPNLVHIFDFDRHQDTYYLAMEYIRGRSLGEANKRARELNTPARPVLVAQVGVEVARGLGYAHKVTHHGKPLNLVHRDVTPQNILLSYDGAVKLTDFGIAKAGGRATTIGTLKGKFAYMAPEQARGDPVDARTDLFALGITLWELLTGARLFHAETDWGVLHAVQERPVPSPAELNPEVDEELSQVVLKALERPKEARYQSGAEFERALLRYVLHHSQAPEDTDVGAFVRELFRVEAETTETTVRARAPLAPGGPAEGSARTVLQPKPAMQRVPAPARAMPPDLLAPDSSDRTELVDPLQLSAAEQTSSGAARPAVEEEPTLRGPAPERLREAARALAAGLKAQLLALDSLAGRTLGKLTGRPSAGPLLVRGAVVMLAVVVCVLLAVALSRPATKGSARPAVPQPQTLPVGPEPAAPPVPVAPPAAPPAAAADEGFFEITLTPGGTVSIDGQAPTQVEGTQRFTLKVGSHEVVASDSKVITAWSIAVRPGATVKKQFTFRKHK